MVICDDFPIDDIRKGLEILRDQYPGILEELEVLFPKECDIVKYFQDLIDLSQQQTVSLEEDVLSNLSKNFKKIMLHHQIALDFEEIMSG